MTADWYVYIVECSDGTLYTGIAKDVVSRVAAHDSGTGAKYTRGRGPVTLLDYVGPMTWSDALKLEYRVKRARGAKKLDVLRHSITS